MRLKANYLVLDEKSYLPNGKLFTGVGFQMVEGILVRAIEYSNGTEIGEYKSTWICTEGNEIALDKDTLESNDGFEPFIFEGERFTGVAYDFDEEFCVGELLFENGLIKEEISFFGGNSPAFYEGFDNGLDQSISWYSDGSLKQFEIIYSDSFRSSFNFDNQERLKSAMIQGGFLDYMDKIKGKLKYNQINSFMYFKNRCAAPYLSLSGSGINDEFVSYLEMENGLNEIQKIAIGDTSLSVDVLTSIIKSQNVKEALIDDSRDILPKALKELKGDMPDCIMELNYEEIVI